MSGIKIELELQDEAFRKAMLDLAARGRSLRPAFKSIGEAMLVSTENRFRDQKGPDGQSWAPLSKRYLKKKKGPKILTESSRLRGSIAYKVGDRDLAWGTNVIYGAIHQLGGTIKQEARRQTNAHGARGGFKSRAAAGKTKGIKAPKVAGEGAHTRISFASIGERTIKMPARPYLGVSTKDKERILSIMIDHLQRAE